MADMNALERQLTDVVRGAMRPPRPVDVAAVVRAATEDDPVDRVPAITRLLRGGSSVSREGSYSMFSAAKLVAAAAVVALFGGFLLLALPGSQEMSPAPAASSSSPVVAESVEPVTPRPTPEEWSGLEATDPRPDTQPDHPLMNVGFGKFDETGTADWRSGTADWRVNDLAREGMELSPMNMAIGPDWDVWQHDQGACGDKMQGEEVPCIWQVGVPGVVFLPEGVELIDLAVGPDGLIWGVSQEGFVAFDGREWVEHDHDAGRDDDVSLAWAVAADGSAWLLDEQPGGRFQLIHATTEGLERIDVAEPSGASDPFGLMYALAVSADGSVLVAGEPSVCFGSFGDCPRHDEPMGFVARFDGEGWAYEDPIGDGAAVTGADVAGGPDGSVWARIDGDDGDHLAKYEGSHWKTFDLDEALQGASGFGGTFLVGSDGTVWIEASVADEGPILMSFDGRSWATHLTGKWGIRDAAAAPDGSVWVSVEDDGVYAVRH